MNYIKSEVATFLVRFRVLFGGVIYLLVGGAGVASAATASLPGINATDIKDLNTAVICAVAYWMFFILMAVAVAMILYAAYRYMTSSGDPEKVKDATRTITYAAVAIVVAIIARGFPLIVISIFPTNVSGGPVCG